MAGDPTGEEPRRMSPERFVSRGETADAFGDEVLVACPRCGRRALLKGYPRPRDAPPARLSCVHCGLAQIFDRPSSGLRDLQPWLQTPCRGRTLSALNAAHLDYLERFVRAELRERVPDPKWGWSNRSLVSRLPRWIQSAKNRPEVLLCIERLKRRLSSESD